MDHGGSGCGGLRATACFQLAFGDTWDDRATGIRCPIAFVNGDVPGRRTW